MTETVKRNIHEKQRRYKQHYDLNRSNPSHKIGELVLIKIISPRSKFDPQFEGSFRIIRQLGPKTFVVQHAKKSTLQRQVTTDVMVPIFERNY